MYYEVYIVAIFLLIRFDLLVPNQGMLTVFVVKPKIHYGKEKRGV
jgi:hypothetical protein